MDKITRQKISAARKGMKMSETTRQRMSEAHKARWAAKREAYLEAQKKSAATRLGKSYRRYNSALGRYEMVKTEAAGRPVYNQYGVRYESVEEAARELGLQERIVYLVLARRRKHTKGFEFTLG